MLFSCPGEVLAVFIHQLAPVILRKHRNINTLFFMIHMIIAGIALGPGLGSAKPGPLARGRDARAEVPIISHNHRNITIREMAQFWFAGILITLSVGRIFWIFKFPFFFCYFANFSNFYSSNLPLTRFLRYAHRWAHLDVIPLRNRIFEFLTKFAEV